MAESIGWAATLVFTASYFCTRAQAIRRIQMVGAAMWLAYGVVLHAAPVIVANALVIAAAGWTTWKSSSA